MYQVEKSVLVMHSAEQMFKLVDAVEDYPKFLPWCGGVVVFSQTETTMHARINIDYHGIKQHFTTQNSKMFPHHMRMHFVDGPFKKFQGEWQFIALQANACKVVFKLEYAFSSSLLEKLIAPVFNHISNTFVDSFVKRADEVK